eukprot:6461773-Amphidinium_carterae.1
MRAAALAKGLWGAEVNGLAGGVFRSYRARVARQLWKLPRRTHVHLYMCARDDGSADPAKVHVGNMLCNWSRLVRSGLVSDTVLWAALGGSAERLATARCNPWARVFGPAGALLMTLHRMGWHVLAPAKFLDERGSLVCLWAESLSSLRVKAAAAVDTWALR